MRPMASLSATPVHPRFLRSLETGHGSFWTCSKAFVSWRPYCYPEEQTSELVLLLGLDDLVAAVASPIRAPKPKDPAFPEPTSRWESLLPRKTYDLGLFQGGQTFWHVTQYGGRRRHLESEDCISVRVGRKSYRETCER